LQRSDDNLPSSLQRENESTGNEESDDAEGFESLQFQVNCVKGCVSSNELFHWLECAEISHVAKHSYLNEISLILKVLLQ